MSGDWDRNLTSLAIEKDDMNLIEKLKAEGHYEFITLSPEERMRWQKASKPIWDKWVASVEDKGLPGRKILD